MWLRALTRKPAGFGVAKGIIAIGGRAQGVVAFGGMAMGGFAFGGMAIGVFAFGGGAIGLISFGGAAIALLAALGGGAIAPIALGGGAIGYLAFGGGAIGAHVSDAVTKDPVAHAVLSSWAKTLMANMQWFTAITVVAVVGLGVGVPLWIQNRAPAGGAGEGGAGPPSQGAGTAPKVGAPSRRFFLSLIIVAAVLLAVFPYHVYLQQHNSRADQPPMTIGVQGSPSLSDMTFRQLAPRQWLDLETGRLVRMPRTVSVGDSPETNDAGNSSDVFDFKQAMAWAGQEGVDLTLDASTNHSPGLVRLVSFGMKIIPLTREDWTDMTSSALADELRSATPLPGEKAGSGLCGLWQL